MANTPSQIQGLLASLADLNKVYKPKQGSSINGSKNLSIAKVHNKNLPVSEAHSKDLPVFKVHNRDLPVSKVHKNLPISKVHSRNLPMGIATIADHQKR